MLGPGNLGQLGEWHLTRRKLDEASGFRHNHLSTLGDHQPLSEKILVVKVRTTFDRPIFGKRGLELQLGQVEGNDAPPKLIASRRQPSKAHSEPTIFIRLPTCFEKGEGIRPNNFEIGPKMVGDLPLFVRRHDQIGDLAPGSLVPLQEKSIEARNILVISTITSLPLASPGPLA